MSLRPTCALVLLLGSCASVQTSLPLPPGRAQEVRVIVEPGLGVLSSAVLEKPAEVGLSPEVLTLRARLISVRPGVLNTGAMAQIVEREDARRFVQTLIDSGEAEELNASSLTLYDDTEGSLQIVNQTAYVAGYELVVDGDTAIADPRVDVITDGLSILAHARLDPDSEAIVLELELTLVALDDPIRKRRVDLGASASVTVQSPSGMTRRITAAPTLGPDEALLLGGRALPAGGGRILLAIVETERVAG